MNNNISCTVNQNFDYPQKLSEYEKDIQSTIKKLSIDSLSINQIKEKYKNIQIYHFERNNKIEDKIVYERRYCEDGCYLQTGLFAGSIYVGDTNIQINTGYENVQNDKKSSSESQIFFYRMLNYVNSIYIDDKYYYGNNKIVPNDTNVIIEYLFISLLKKNANLLIPREYKRLNERSLNIRGQLNLKDYLKKDIIYKDKISYTYLEQVFVEKISQIIFYALNVIEKRMKNKKIDATNGFISYQELRLLKQKFAMDKVFREPLQKDFYAARNHKCLNNPMYKAYKRILSYAELIIRNNGKYGKGGDSKDAVYGYLLDISKLWESYLARILEINFPEWVVDEQEDIYLYQSTFFAKHNYPDLVLRRGNEVIIFDAKFKHMNFEYNDVDREDLFQINSYVGYYKTLGMKVVLAGLLYPLSSDAKMNQGPLYGIESSETKFVVTGIKATGISNFETLKDNEEKFIQEIRGLLE